MTSNSIYPSSKILPYVYRLDNPTTGEFYIGYRKANKVPSHLDLPKYKTSAPKVKARFEEFNWTIIAEFFDGESAFIFEQFLIKENFKTPGILNKRYFENGTYKMFTLSGSANGMFGRNQTTESIAKMKANRTSTKGKSYEDLYGIEQASILKTSRSNSTKKFRETNPLNGVNNPMFGNPVNRNRIWYKTLDNIGYMLHEGDPKIIELFLIKGRPKFKKL